jgi:alpha-1,2-mannosyltransferase
VTLIGIAGSLASPVSWVHHLIWILPAILIMLREGMARGSVWWLGLAAGVFATFSFSLVALYDETVPRLTGVIGIVTGDWDAFVLLALLVVLPRSLDGLRKACPSEQGAHTPHGDGAWSAENDAATTSGTDLPGRVHHER